MLWVMLCAGVLVGGGAIAVAQQLLFAMNEASLRTRLSHWTYAVGAVTGGITGWSIHRSSQEAASALQVIVMLLFLVQAPIDLMTHRLIRPLTYLCIAITMSVEVVDVLVADSPWGEALRDVASAVVVTLIVVGAYTVLHRLSPRSLGWGDVLLVVPLSLAVGYVHLASVAVWQLIASLTAAAYALTVRGRSGSAFIAFGPHLLFAAWLVLLVSV